MGSGYIEGHPKIEQQLWKNLTESGLLEKILSKSEHAVEPSEYTHAKIWSELNTGLDYKSGLWLQPQIHAPTFNAQSGTRVARQPVVPKLYRLSGSTHEQLAIAQRIWEGVSHDDVYQMTLQQLTNFIERERQGWLTVDRAIIFRKLYPAVQEHRVEMELMPLSASYRVRVQE